jgi:hypothetical protein
MAPQEFASDIERLAGGLQQGEVCGEDVRHALPDVQFGLRAELRRPVRVSARIVEQGAGVSCWPTAAQPWFAACQELAKADNRQLNR